MAVGTLVTGQRGTANIDSTQRKIDMAEKIMLLEPDSTPLTVISKKIGALACFDPKFQWQEDELDPRWDKISNGGGYLSTDTSLVVANPGYYAAQQVLYFPRTGETIRVTSTNSGAGPLTVVRGIGSTAQALIDQDEILITGSVQPEGDASKPARTRNPAANYNYTEIIRDEWDATETERISVQQTDDDWQHQSLKKGIEHAKNVEYAMMVHNRNEDTSSGQARRQTGGFLFYATQNTTDAAANLTELGLFTALRPAFRYGSGEKWGFASMRAVDVLTAFPRSHVQIRQDETTFGMRVMQYISPHGTLNLVTHRLLEGSVLGGQIWIMDSDVVKYRHLTTQKGSRDSHINTNIQPPDVDGRKDEWLTECGFQPGQSARHGRIINI